MSETWITFARTGRPDSKAIPHWPTYDLERRATMMFDVVSRVVNDPRGDERRMFARVPYVQAGT